MKISIGNDHAGPDYKAAISKSGYITGYMGAFPDAVIYISAANFGGNAHAFIYW